MKFVWTEFGKLIDYQIGPDGYFYIQNDLKQSRKMSPKYNSVFGQMESKSKLLRGKMIQIRTSQNTGNWSSDTWFSDISLSESIVTPSNRIEEIESVSTLEKKLVQIKKERDDANKKLSVALDHIEQANSELEESRKNEYSANSRAKLASERAEHIHEKYNDASKVIEKLERDFSHLQAEYDALTVEEQHKVDHMSGILLKMNLVGTKKDCVVRGHPKKMFALRCGINLEHRGRLHILIKKHLRKNYFVVSLLDFDNMDVEAALGFDNETFFIKTVEPTNSKLFREVLEELYGQSEALIKSSSDTYSFNELINMHNQIISAIKDRSTPF